MNSACFTTDNNTNNLKIKTIFSYLRQRHFISDLNPWDITSLTSLHTQHSSHHPRVLIHPSSLYLQKENDSYKVAYNLLIHDV